jgi:hypothetical protein
MLLEVQEINKSFLLFQEAVTLNTYVSVLEAAAVVVAQAVNLTAAVAVVVLALLP